MKYVIGIDEVGRGCLAGPVTVTALAVPANFQFSISNFQNNKKAKNLELKDSKQLSAKQREEWCEYIKQHSKIFYCTSSVSPKVIDRINISAAANLAAYRAVLGIQKSISELLRHGVIIQISNIFLDGGLYLKNKEYQKLLTDFKVETVIKGDENIGAIKLASIVAKVSRDKLMSSRFHKLYPEYAFDSHKGYGTKAHRTAIKKSGISEIHRKTFVTKL